MQPAHLLLIATGTFALATGFVSATLALQASSGSKQIRDVHELQQAADALKGIISTIKQPQLQGRGILIPAGGDELLTNAFVSVQALSSCFCA